MNLGLVVDVNDPRYEGRCRIREFGKHTQHVNEKDLSSPYVIDVGSLPWARPANNSTSAEFNLPKLGDVVRIEYDGNKYSPVYYETVLPSYDTINLIKNEVNDYRNAHVLINDSQLGAKVDELGNQSNTRDGEFIRVYYLDSQGFVIHMTTQAGESKVVMDKSGSITLSTPSNSIVLNGETKEITIKSDSVIKLDCDNVEIGTSANESIMLGNFLETFNSHTHISNINGGETTPPLQTGYASKHTTTNKVKVRK